MDPMSIAAVKAFFSKNAAKVAIFAGLAALAVVILTLAYCTGRHDGKQGQVVGQLEREIAVGKATSSAAATAADARATDAAVAVQQKKELDDAFQAAIGPDQRRALRGCVILRQQGRDTTRIPACTGSR